MRPPEHLDCVGSRPSGAKAAPRAADAAASSPPVAGADVASLQAEEPVGEDVPTIIAGILQRAKAMHADICDEKREAMRTYEVLRRYQLAVSGGDSSGELSAQR